ncbi:MAG: hypothetical protein O2960_01875 [Verrucomicrobia bacterium]|nr:hypothetical protein [Verrucomicrobiota bacterium]
MRCVYLAAVLFVFSVSLPGQVRAMEFRLTNGDTHSGEAVNFDDLGLTIRIDIGGFASRIGWGKLSQETLRELAKDPKAVSFVDPFIEPTPEELERVKAQTRKVIVLKDVERIENPPKEGFVASMSTPVGIAFAIAFFIVNLYAAYEIAVFRKRPIVLVCGLSVILPGIGPILILSLPSREEILEPEYTDPGSSPAPAEALVTNPLASPGAPRSAASGLGIAASQKAATSTPTGVDGSVFKRGDTTFNRRFFETKFPGFFRVVPSEADKDLVLVIRAAKNEYVAKRISRITANEMHVQTQRGGGSEATIAFSDVIEVRVRHKDAKA